MTIDIAETDALAIPKVSVEGSALTDSYDELLISVQGDLISLAQDYTELYPSNATTRKMGSLANAAVKTLTGEPTPSVNASEMAKLENELASVHKTFSPASAIPAECAS
jgi:hypothetical protein